MFAVDSDTRLGRDPSHVQIDGGLGLHLGAGTRPAEVSLNSALEHNA
jgi:hypothetical protein